MNACKTPCKECPFVKGAPAGWLGPYDDAVELHQYLMRVERFACHMAQKSERLADVGDENNPVCAGSLAYMRQNCKRPIDKEIKALVDAVTPAEKARAFTMPELVKYHEL